MSTKTRSAASTGDGTRNLLALDPASTEAEVVRHGGRAFHAREIRRAVLQKGVLDYGEMTFLSAALRERLARELPITTGRELDRRTSDDGTTKLLIGFESASVETVHIPSRKKDRGATLCVSTQIGCPVACPFCASGKLGLERNLKVDEILEQYVRGRAIGELARSVVMGIGEPMLNLDATTRALDRVRDEMGIGARRITVSTVGFPDRLDRLAPTRPGFQLAISLHSPFDEERWELVPAMKGVPVADVLAAGDRWFEATGREITYEYVLLGGSNDTAEHAAELGRRLAGRRATVNLIPYNPVAGDRWKRPAAGAAEAFRGSLEAAGVVATIRWSRGLEADAACGQLRMGHGESPYG